MKKTIKNINNLSNNTLTLLKRLNIKVNKSSYILVDSYMITDKKNKAIVVTRSNKSKEEDSILYEVARYLLYSKDNNKYEHSTLKDNDKEEKVLKLSKYLKSNYE